MGISTLLLIILCLSRFVCWSKRPINMIQINRGKSHLMMSGQRIYVNMGLQRWSGKTMYIFHPKLRRGCRACDFKGEEGNSQGERKEYIFGKQMFAEPSRNNGTQKGHWSNNLLGSSLSATPGSHTVSMVIAPFLEQVLYPNSLGS